MKNFLYVFALAQILIFTSCSDESCVDEAIGTYVGTESCPGTVSNLTVIVGPSSVEDRIVLTISGTDLTFNGDLTSGCSNIIVPSQNISINGFPGNIDGTLTLGNNVISGSLTFSSGETCTYNLNRQ